MNFCYDVMKRLVLILFLMILTITTVNVFAEERLILIEHFTGASCSPCAHQNPVLEELLSRNTDKIILLTHQCFIPAYDPMYEDYPEGTDKRRSYYGINSAPTTVLDGNVKGPTSPSNIKQNDLDARFAAPSPFKIDLTYQKNDEKIDVKMIITADDNIVGHFKARIAVIENEIHFDEPPGSNGEKEFNKVLKQFLPSPEGIDIQDNWAKDQSYEINESWTFKNIYDFDEIAVVAYVQNDDTKEIMQAAFAEVEPQHEFDAKLSKLHEFPVEVCPGMVGDFASTAVVTNYGNEPITSFDIECKINDSEGEVINWTGNLDLLDFVVIHFPELELGKLAENNIISAKISNINGKNEDENINNNEVVEEFNAYMAVSSGFKMKFRAGTIYKDFLWRLVCDGQSKVPDEFYNYRGGYNSSDTNEVIFELPEDCWRIIFKIKNSSNVKDFFLEIIDDEEVKFRTETIGYLLHLPLYITETTSVEDFEQVDESNPVFPNPSIGIINLNNANIADVEVFDLMGNKLFDYEKLPINSKINLTHLSNGIYILRILEEGGIYTKTVILNK